MVVDKTDVVHDWERVSLSYMDSKLVWEYICMFSVRLQVAIVEDIR